MRAAHIVFFSHIFQVHFLTWEAVLAYLQAYGIADEHQWFELEDDGETIGRYQLLCAGVEWQQGAYLGQANLYDIDDLLYGILGDLLLQEHEPSEWDDTDLNKRVCITLSGYVFEAQ